MIAHLTGTVTTTSPTETVLSVRGVGYLVQTTPLSLTPNETITLYTYLSVKETALELYGFLTPAERSLFCKLLTVPKVGPKSALQLLSRATSDTIIIAISSGDPKHFKAQTGVGGKTAENIIATLQKEYADAASSSITPTPTGYNPVFQDVVAALITLGFDEASASARVAELDTTAAETTSISELIKQALQAR